MGVVRVVEFGGHLRNGDGRILPKPLCRLLEPVASDHCEWGQADVLLTEALETADRKIEASHQLIDTQDTSATTPNRRQFRDGRLDKLSPTNIPCPARTTTSQPHPLFNNVIHKYEIGRNRHHNRSNFILSSEMFFQSTKILFTPSPIKQVALRFI